MEILQHFIISFTASRVSAAQFGFLRSELKKNSDSWSMTQVKLMIFFGKFIKCSPKGIKSVLYQLVVDYFINVKKHDIIMIHIELTMKQ